MNHRRPSMSSLRRRILDRLMAAGTWVERAELDGLSALPTVLEDELADMVIERQIEHQRGAGYRMPGGPMVRLAMQELQHVPELRRSVKGRPVGEPGNRHLVLGVAERRRLPGDAIDTVVTYCIELPAADLAGRQQQLAALATTLDKHPVPLAPGGPS